MSSPATEVLRGGVARSGQLQASGAPSLGLTVVPIYAALSPEQQARVFEPAPVGMRKVRSQLVSAPDSQHNIARLPQKPSINAAGTSTAWWCRSSWPPTSQRRPSRCRVCATWWTRASSRRAATARTWALTRCRSCRSRRRRRASAAAAQACTPAAHCAFQLVW
jgi:hypothetical protein